MKKFYLLSVLLVLLFQNSNASVDLKIIRPIIHMNDTMDGYYDRYFLSAFEGLYLGAEIVNNGTGHATGVKLKVTAIDWDSVEQEVYLSSAITLSAGNSTIISIDGLLTFSPLYLTQLRFEILSDSTDINPSDNIMTAPFPGLTSGNWGMEAARAIQENDIYMFGGSGNLQSGDEFGITFHGNGIPHFLVNFSLILGEPADSGIDFTIKAYKDGILITTCPADFYQPDPNVVSFEIPHGVLIEDGHIYWFTIKIDNLQDSLKVVVDTSIYHDFSQETIAFHDSTEVPLNFVPVIRMYADPVGIDEMTNASGVCVYPNPAHNHLNISSALPHKIEIMNSDGKLVLKDDQLSTKTNLNISKLNPGLYLVRILSGDKTVTRKVTVY